MNEVLSPQDLAKSRKPKYAKDNQWIQDFLETCDVGHIATRWDGQPFITPSTFWYDPERHEIFFHSNIRGRIRTNVDRHSEVCFEASRVGNSLPSNVALQFSIQYASVIVFGQVRVLEDLEDQRYALYGLIRKYFPDMTPGEHYRPITDEELRQTSVYSISISSWSGKENWKENADQSEDWPRLDSGS
jgi:nitroimidazol reductase NimA-like FMN-containing flavoprotein (pyridoxamine 5'-phosphate oxidase superfamily)